MVDVILVRMGIHIFNREELLGREIDELNVPSLWRTFYSHLRWKRWFFGQDVDQLPTGLRWLGTLGGLYGRDIPNILRRSRSALVLVVVGLLCEPSLTSQVPSFTVAYHDPPFAPVISNWNTTSTPTALSA